jgi:Transposase DDE domain
VMVLSCWAKGYHEPLYLVSNLATAEEACRYYQKRFRIETFFSDQKSRGFHIHKSHIADPQRLSRFHYQTLFQGGGFSLNLLNL